MLLLSHSGTDNLRQSTDPQVRCYTSSFADRMEMLAPTAVVADYLDRHDVWFERCAAPIQVKSLDRQSYGLTLGRSGNFGFEIEPTISLRLLPQDQLVYRIETTDLAWGDSTLRNLYEVDFQARMELKPWAESEGMDPGLATAVSWNLDLSVWVRLPQVLSLIHI